MKTYEVELRALLSKEKHDELFIQFEAITPGEIDDAQTYTFLTSSINIKVKNMTSRAKAKITVKNGAEYSQQTDESELPIDPKDVKKAVALITALGYPKHIPSLQKRINYQIGDITVSLKHETHWKYHIEAEIVVDSEVKMPEAKEKLHKFFHELDIVPMTEEENHALVNSVVVKYGIDLI